MLVVVTRAPCGDSVLQNMAVQLRSQSLAAWQWLVVGVKLPWDLRQEARIRLLASEEQVRLWTQSPACVAWIRLDEPEPWLVPRAFEQLWWFLRGHPRARCVAYDGSPGADARLSARRHPPARQPCWLRGAAGVEAPPVTAGPPGGRHLLMLLPWLEPGGADRCNLDIARQLRVQGWTLSVVATLEAAHAWAPRFRELSDDVLVLPRFLAAASVKEFLLHLLESRMPDLLLLSNCRLGYDLLPTLRGQMPHLPVIDLNHMEEGWGAGGYPGLAVRHDAEMLRHWVVSRHLRQWMLARGVAAQRVEVLHWFADAQRWRPDTQARRQFRQAFGIARRTPVIVYAGRLCRQKRPDLFAASLRKLADSGQEFLALVIGDGELAADLRRDLQHLRLEERVRWLGWLDEDGLRRALQASDLFFLPSEAEGIALVLYEAMACALPVVASNVGGQAELVDATCGCLIGPRSRDPASDYAAALGRLLKDPLLLRDMGARARERVLRHFDARAFGQRLLALLEQAVQLPVPRAGRQSARQRSLALARLRWQWRCRRLLARCGLFRQGRLQRLLTTFVKATLYVGIHGSALLRVKERRN
ncbi:glycosyltransferase family 4 protein [Pseudomonas delhiensis]|uniref:glycosyltransferase family 4 protein n=1 Tax=Pseudomonas delhiensis TaxID=366289 RepID=UPI003159BE4B